MPRPSVRRATELPVVSWNDWDNVQLVKQAIRSMEMGVFNEAALVVEGMGRDDRISGCLETRTRALPSLPLNLEPRGDGRQKKAVAKELDEYFEDLYPDTALAELHHWGITLGVGLGENVWEFGEKRWLPRLKVWHPRFISYRQDTRSFWVQTMEGPREVIPGDGQWVLYTPYGMNRGWMKAKVRSLYVPWLMRTWGLRDWARYSEVHGHPIKKVVTPAGAEEEAKRRFLTEVAALGSEAVIRTPRVEGSGNADADRYDLELLEAMNNNWETFEGLLNKAEACISIAILGQNLSTEVKGGSFAATVGHMQIREDVLQTDAGSLGQCLRKQSIAWWALLNFGSAELAPMPKWKTKARPPETAKARGESLQAIGAGMNELRKAGARPDVDKILEEEEVPVLGPAEELDREDLQPPEAPAPSAGGKPARPSLPRPKAALASQKTTWERWSEKFLSPEQKAQLAKLQKDEEAAQLAQDTGDVPPAAIEGQLFVDRLADDGTANLAGAMSKDVKSVLAAIADAPDFQTLRARLVKLYGDMDESTEAKLLHHGMVMAELAGRLAAKKEAGLEDGEEEAS